MIRFVSGMAVGAASVVAPAYIAEISPAAMRGRLTSLQQMGIVVGIFVAFLVDYLITLAAGGVTEPFWFGLEAWRCMFLTEAVPALALVGASLVIPESPRFLVGQGRDDEALAVLQHIDASQGQGHDRRDPRDRRHRAQAVDARPARPGGPRSCRSCGSASRSRPCSSWSAST